MTELDSEQELAELDPSEERRLCELLRNAYAPTQIDPARHERLLLSALEDPFAPPSAEELVESERLRQALDGQGEHEDLALARALAAAFAPGSEAPPLGPNLTQPTRAASAPKALPQRRRSNVILLRFAGGGAALAAAAAVLLSILPKPPQESAPDLRVLALAQSRSTAPLFQADSGEAASSRIDRIASVRGRDLRDNRYALWGVR
jgi:hypothetical protein